MAETSLGIKIAVDTAQVKTNLDKVQAAFEKATATITKALSSIKGFDELQKQTEATAKAYGEAQQKVSALAQEIQAGAGGAALAKDFERAKTEAAKLQQSLSGQQQQLQQARTAMSALGVSTTNLSGQQAGLRAQLDATKQKYQDLAKVAAARDTLELTPHIEITGEINKARAAYATLAASGKLSMAELAQAKVALGDKIDALTMKTNGWRDALGQIKGRVVEVAAAFAGIVMMSKQAIAFESAMADVGKTVDGTKEQIAQLGNELRDMSFKVPLSAEELAAIAAAGGQLGIAAGDIGKFTEVTAKMATAFNMTAEAAGQAIGTMSNVWQVGVGDIELFGDAINQLGNNTAATESKIVDVLLRIGGTARQFGLAKEQAAALAATMISLGQAPEVASTSINALLVRMQTATQQSSTFQAALERIGMSAEEMAVMVEANPQKALETLLNTLSELKGRERAEVLTGLFGAEYQDNIAVLVGSLDEYRKSLGLVSDKSKYAGAMNAEFEKRLETTKAQLQLLWNVITDVGRSIGSGFLPPIKAAATFLREMLSPIAELVREVPGLSAILVSLGTGAMVFGTVAKVIDIAKMAMISFGATATAAFGEAGLAATSFATTLASSFRAAIAAGAIGYAIGTWLNQFDVVKKAGVATAHVLTMGWLKVREAWAKLTGGDTAGIQREMDIARQTYTKMMDEINGKAKESSGVRVAEEKKVGAAVEKSASAQKKVSKEALEAMQKQYKDYADEVKRLQEDISGRERSLASELREMSRSGMSDSSAWKDQKREAQEYEQAAREAAQQAKAAMEAGDTVTATAKWKEAVSYADEAKQSYKGLNEEVKEGDRVLISKQQALQAAMAGVKSAGELAISITKQQQAATVGAMNALTEKSGFANLAEGMTEAEQKWLASWEQMKNDAGEKITLVKQQIADIGTSAANVKAAFADAFQPPADGDWGKVWTAMESGSTKAAGTVASDWDKVWDSWLESGSDDVEALNRKLSELIKDRTMTVRIKTVEEKSTGGLIGGYHLGGAIQALATGGDVRNIIPGGHLPGFGGGDTVPLWGEAGEFMINKWASLKAGLPALKYLNAGDIGSAIAELTKRLQTRFGYRLGGMVESISGGAQRLATGRVVAGGGESMTIHLNFPSGSTVPVQATPQLARQLLRELERLGFRASA